MNITGFDGGGMRGAMSLAAYYCVQQTAADAEMFFGASIGGDMSIALAQGEKIASLLYVFKTHAKDIFKPRWFGGLFNAKYGSAGRLRVFKTIISDTPKKSLPWLCTISPYGWNGPPVAFYDGKNPPKISPLDAAMATSAAPTYFPKWKGFIDGAVEDNNPIVQALYFAERLRPGERHHITSFGTGRKVWPDKPSGKGDWGIAQWGANISDAFLHMSAEREKETVQAMAAQRYIKFTLTRYNRILPRNVALDDVSAVGDLIKWGYEMAEKPEYVISN